MRFGHGFDAHAFEENRKLILCGVEIPHEKGLAGHSDADVGIHALCDALLGAAALGDIGKHFPGTAEYKNIDSRVLLRKVITMLSQNGYRLNNADITLIAQAPKLSPHIEKMRSIIAEDTQADLSSINIKATTTDGLGFTGRKEGIAAHAVVSLIKP